MRCTLIMFLGDLYLPGDLMVLTSLQVQVKILNRAFCGRYCMTHVLQECDV